MSQGHDEVTLANPDSAADGGPGAFVLRVIEGVDKGRSLEVNGTEPSPLLVGKGPTATLQLRDPSVSRRQLSVEIERGQLHIVDTGSMNGTRIDNVRITDGYAAGGEHLYIGNTVIYIERVAPHAHESRPQLSHFARVVGASPAMQRLYPLCDKLAKSDVPVIIEGETGTGKEALAEALHEAGPRAQNAFVVFDCTSVPPSLLESELFGHERGAFTGANTMRKGVFELADGGTLLIDEIGDLELSLQPKLLRAVERAEFRRVGGTKAIKCNVRLLAATRRDLEREVQLGRFRDDLFHRLAVGRIELPPLRKRREDIELLARHFWDQAGGDASGPPPDALAAWMSAAWPGNVRELRNAVSRRLALGDLDTRNTATALAGAPSVDGSAEIDSILAQNLPFPRARRMVLAAFERRYVERALAAAGGSVVAAATASGIARRYFQLIRDRYSPGRGSNFPPKA
ncbi:MAG: sigma 54-interacting transcriptional regulator [Polyangiaceae bacterium]